MARDPLSDAWTPDESNTNSKLLDYVRMGAYGAAGYAGAKSLQYGSRQLFANLTDTHGFGGLGGDPRYANTGKWNQIWDNFMQAHKGQKGNALTKTIRVGGEVFRGGDLELLAAEESIREVKNELKNPTLTEKEKVTLKNELKNRKRDYQDRKVAVHNKYKVAGITPPKVTQQMDYAKPALVKVTPLMTKVEEGLAPYLGKTVPATIFSEEKMEFFKGYAKDDPRVKYVTNLLAEGKVKTAKVAAEGGHYIFKDNLVVPERDERGIPIRKDGKTIGGMKLQLLPREEWYIENGRKVRTYGLGFVPLNRRLDKAMDFVAGRHWQQLKFIPHGKGYRKVSLSVIDHHDYAFNKPMRFIERRLLGAKPVVNIGTISNYRKPYRTSAKSEPTTFQSSKRIYPASRKQLQYASTKIANKKATKSLLQSALKLVGYIR